MLLNEIMRGILENLIDESIKVTPFYVEIARGMPPELNI
jgi:hypothetical protein